MLFLFVVPAPTAIAFNGLSVAASQPHFSYGGHTTTTTSRTRFFNVKMLCFECSNFENIPRQVSKGELNEYISSPALEHRQKFCVTLFSDNKLKKKSFKAKVEETIKRRNYVNRNFLICGVGLANFWSKLKGWTSHLILFDMLISKTMIKPLKSLKILRSDFR